MPTVGFCMDPEESVSSRRGDREKARVDAALIAARSQMEQRKSGTRSVKQALNWSIWSFIATLLTALIGLWAWSRIF